MPAIIYSIKRQTNHENLFSRYRSEHDVETYKSFTILLQITADTNKACTDDFGASSAATAMASGLIALMLSAKLVGF